MGIKQLQRIAIDKDYRPYKRRDIEFVAATEKPGLGYYVSIASMIIIVFCVAYSIF